MIQNLKLRPVLYIFKKKKKEKNLNPKSNTGAFLKSLIKKKSRGVI